MEWYSEEKGTARKKQRGTGKKKEQQREKKKGKAITFRQKIDEVKTVEAG